MVTQTVIGEKVGWCAVGRVGDNGHHGSPSSKPTLIGIGARRSPAHAFQGSLGTGKRRGQGTQEFAQRDNRFPERKKRKLDGFPGFDRWYRAMGFATGQPAWVVAGP